MASTRSGAIPAREDRYEHSVLRVCEALHFACMDVSDISEKTADSFDKKADWLRYRVRDWYPTKNGGSAEYDSLIYALATRALVDYEAWRQTTRGGA